MNSMPNGKANETADSLVAPAHEQPATAYEQVAPADYKRTAPGDQPPWTASAPKPKTIEPNEALIARADERLAHAYEQIASADEQLACVTEQLSKLEQDAVRSRPASPGRRRSSAGSLVRGLVGLLLAACIFAAALFWQSPGGETAKLAIARWVPRPGVTSSLALRSVPVEPSQSASGVAGAGPMPTTHAAESAPQHVAPAAAPVSAESAQISPMIAQTLASIQRRIDELKSRQDEMTIESAKAIERLKTSQDQIASDNAKALEQIKASQGQMSQDNARAFEQLKASQEQAARDNAKTAEQLKAMASFTARVSKQSLQSTPSTAASRPVASPTRRAPTHPPAQARVQP